MRALASMISNLTLPYRNAAYLRQIPLGDDLQPGLTAVLPYDFDDYAVRAGVSPWDVTPMYLVAPVVDVGDQPVCLYFKVVGVGGPWSRLHVPAGTRRGTSFVVPLAEDVRGTTLLHRVREWPAPATGQTGRERWRIEAVVGNLGRLLWALGWEKAVIQAVAGDVGAQRNLESAHGRSLDLLGQELLVPRLPPTAYPPDPATIALYHLDELPEDSDPLALDQMRVHDVMRAHDGLNEGAVPGATGRFGRAFAFCSGDLPPSRCAADQAFQQRLRSGDWDARAGVREVRAGPYRRYGYREGAISVRGPDGQEQPVWVNDEARDPAARGLVTTACHGFVPTDLDDTIARLAAVGLSTQEAVDYYGEWWGLPDSWFTAAYGRYGIEAPHDRCDLPAVPETYIRIPNHQAFAIPAGQGFTVEAFVLPTPTDDDRLRVVAIKSRDIFYGGPLQVHCLEGWALTMGRFNCIPNNVAWSISDLPDGPADEHEERVTSVTADLDLGDGAWHHLAGVIDRRRGAIRLYVDGVERGCRQFGPVGGVTNQEDILLGNDDYRFDAPFDGLIDEVRLSSIARTRFHPALGESDGRYRTRLGIYRAWLVPTQAELSAGLHRLLAASPYDPDVSAPRLPDIGFSERPSTMICSEHRLAIRPLALPPGGHIDLQGSRQRSEEEACGPRDNRFFEWQLVAHDHPDLEYAQPGAHRMQLAAARSLDELARLLAPWRARGGGRPRVLAAYQPGLDLLASVGRAVVIAPPPDMPAGVLAAFAHKACFDHVCCGSGDTVRAAVREELDKLEVATAEEAGQAAFVGRHVPIDAEVDTRVLLTVARPVVPDAKRLSWSVVQCGPARARLEPVTGDEAARVLVPTAPGRLVVQAEIPWQGAVVSGRRDVRVLPHALPPCQSIAADGALGLGEAAAAGDPAGFFDPALLVDYQDPRVDNASGPAATRVQLGLARALDRLLDILDAEPGVSGRLRVLGGYDPGAGDLARVGRKLQLAHDNPAAMPLGRLAALAHRAGFAWVEHPPYPTGIHVAVGPAPMLEVVIRPIQRLAPNAEVNWLGIMRVGMPEAPVPPGASFDSSDPANRYSDPADRVAFDALGADLMLPATQERVGLLLDLLDAEDRSGRLHVLQAFIEPSPDRRRIGAAVHLRHETVPLDRLGALAHQAGFDYVKHVTVPSDPAARYVYASVWRGQDLSAASLDELPLLEDFGLLDPGDVAGRSELAEEAVAELCVRPDPVSPPAEARLPETAEFDWCLTRYGPGAGRLDTAAAEPCKLLTAQAAGVIGARVELLLGDGAAPYRFELVVQDDDPSTPPLPKVVYDDVLNFLEAHLPVGVEGRAAALRRHVPELLADPVLGAATTERTYPRYRQPARTAEPPVPTSQVPEVVCPCPPWPASHPEGAQHA